MFKMNIKNNVMVYLFLMSFFYLGEGMRNAWGSEIKLWDEQYMLDDQHKDDAYIRFNLSVTDLQRKINATSWDAIWLFAKYSVWDTQLNQWQEWKHCSLSSNDQDHDANNNSIDMSTGNTDGVGKGVFIYRNKPATGKATFKNIGLRWKYGVGGDLLDSTMKIRIKVFAVEMVYIPDGGFYVGDTDNTNINNLHEGGSSHEFYISSEDVLNVGNSQGQLFYGNNGVGGDQLGPIPADFPKGYKALYLMKYELMSYQYADFLNHLTTAQQHQRVVTVQPGKYAMSNQDSVHFRSVIRRELDGQTFGCDLDGDGILNEVNDGQWIAANYLTWMDLMAFADWAGLRPMSELEFEKACRGPAKAIDDEMCWGNSVVEKATTALNNEGTSLEEVNQGNLNYRDADPEGPFRSGAFVRKNATRQSSGAGYYGNLELSGNLWERTVSIGNPQGRNFNGHIHGDGTLSAAGHANQSTWPGMSASGELIGAEGAGFRGGTFYNAHVHTRVADRVGASNTDSGRTDGLGGRLARSAPEKRRIAGE